MDGLTTNAQISNFNAITSPSRAISMLGKRSELNLVVAAMIQCVDSLGYLGIRRSMDGDLAIRVMAARMPKHRPRTIIGARLSSVRPISWWWSWTLPEAQRDMNYGMRVWSSHTVWLLMLRHAAWSRHRGGVHSCASTSREQLSPYKYPRDTLIWGVCVVLEGLVRHTAWNLETETAKGKS